MGISRLPLARFEPPLLRTIARDRVDRRLDRAWEVPLTVIVGPAGAGKTTAASHLVERSAGRSLWYRAHAVDGDEASLCDHLAQAWEHATTARVRWQRFADVLVDIERADRTGDLLIVIDEFDAIVGTPTEDAIGQAVSDIGPSIHLVTLSRNRPSFNLSRLRVADAVCEVGPDDLRFRSWEVDRLFRELYGRPLLPDEVSELERRTGGWVAALHLFNMAVAGLAPVERRAVLAQVGRRAGPDWDFLADNVLAGLRDDLKLFLLETAPLPRLTAALCDDLLGATDSWQRLAELERLQLVTASMESPGSYRSHAVLRSHLDGLLLEWEGADAVRKRYRQAAESLESHGDVTDALSAYCRGEDWPSAGRLLGSRGAEVADRPGTWLGGLPTAFLETDPWLLLAVARQQRSDGRLAEAIATYQRVERAALSSVPVSIARRERLLLASLLDRSSPPALAWIRALRDAAFGDLTAVHVEGRSPHDDLARGVVQLLGGDVGSATGSLRAARDAREASPALALAAGLGLLVAGFLAGTATAADADDLERAATLLEIPFLGRLCCSAAGMVTGDRTQLAETIADCERCGDAVGAAVAGTFGALAEAWAPMPSPVDDAVVTRCRDAGLRNAEAWARVAASLAAARGGWVADGPHDGAPPTRRPGPGPLRRLAALADELAGPRRQELVQRHVTTLADAHGIVVPVATVVPLVPVVPVMPVVSAMSVVSGEPVQPVEASADPDAGPDVPGPLELQCFGRFTAGRGGVPIDLTALRPRARAVLRLLAVASGTGVHRQVLCEELWPADPEDAAARKLHVAISSIRKVVGVAGGDVVHRHGELYLLAGAVRCDVAQFEHQLAVARAAATDGEPTLAEAALRQVLELHTGALLPEDVGSDWVEARRRHLRGLAAEAARRLAELLMARGDAVGAIEACRAGLVTDRYSDPLWRLLLRALDADGDLAGHARALDHYDAVLDELGIEPTPRPA